MNRSAEAELQNQVLKYSASIHQPHAIKTFLAAQNLYTALKNEALWNQVECLLKASEIYNQQTYSNQIETPQFSKNRIQSILKRGIYPVAYSAMLQWYNEHGFDNIFQYYLEQSSLKNEYLFHNFTILLSFYEMYPKLIPEQRYSFLDRLTEFVTATFNDFHDITEPTLSQLHLTDDVLLQVCLKQPSVFGHNLITLAWLIRYETKLPMHILQQLKFYLHIQATTPLEDPEDELQLELFQQCSEGDEAEFLDLLNALIFQQCKNLHQITLADALLYLQQLFPTYTAELKRITEYQVRLLK